MNKKKKSIVLLIVLLLLLVGIGYASLKVKLTINGTSTIKNNNFAIKFANIVEKSGSVTPTTAATIGSDEKSITFDVSLEKPGDYYGFNIDVINSGALNAVVQSFQKTKLTAEQEKYLTYEVTYSDGTDIVNGDVLTRGTSKTVVVLLSYKENPEEYPQVSEQILSFSFDINYVEEASYVPRNTANEYAQELPIDLTSETNLYEVLEPREGYYNATTYGPVTNRNVVSIVIPVLPGDRIKSNSFSDADPNNSATYGIRVTFLKDDTIVTSKTATEINSEYTENGYITVPEGVNAVCIPWWAPSDSNWAYLLVD